MLNQADFLLVNLKEIIEDLQAKNVHFQTQVEKLTVGNNKLTCENKQLIIFNKNLTGEENFLKKDFNIKNF